MNERKHEEDLNLQQGEVALGVPIWSPPTSYSGVFFGICPEGVFPGGVLSAPPLSLVGNLASIPFVKASPRSEQEGQEENTVTPKVTQALKILSVFPQRSHRICDRDLSAFKHTYAY